MLAAYTGLLAGLGAAMMWAVASVLFGRVGALVPPLALNLYKGVIACGMLLTVLALRSELSAPSSLHGVLLLLVSGVIGIGVGDTAFFASLNRLGPRRTVLMAETLAPPITALAAFFSLSEALSVEAIFGAALTIAGVAAVILEKKEPDKQDAKRLRSGVAFGILAALCQAIGVVTSRGVLTQTDIGPLWSALIRLAGGVLILLMWAPALRQSIVTQKITSSRIWGFVLLATFLGTFLGIFLQQLSLQHSHAGVAQTLMATSALFVMPIMALRGEPISLRAIAGALLAVGGVGLIFAAN